MMDTCNCEMCGQLIPGEAPYTNRFGEPFCSLICSLDFDEEQNLVAAPVIVGCQPWPSDSIFAEQDAPEWPIIHFHDETKPN